MFVYLSVEKGEVLRTSFPVFTGLVGIAPHDLERTHHIVILVFENVTVPGKLAGKVPELNGDPNRLVRIDPYGILSYPLVWIWVVTSVRATTEHVECCSGIERENTGDSESGADLEHASSG